MPKPFYLLILVLAVCAQPRAQQINSQVFTVVSISENAGYKPAQLNSLLAPAKTMDDARNIIRSQRFKNAIIKLYISVPGAAKKYWKIDTRNESQSSDNFRVLRSKGTERINITRLNDFRELLPDTLLILEDILLNVNLTENGYKDSWYTIHQFCNNKENTVTATKNKDKQLVLTPAIANCDPYTTIDICNDYNPKRQLRRFAAIRLNDHDNKILEQIAKDYLQDNANSTAESFHDFMDAVMTTYYGRPLRSALENWIRTHISTTLK